jgi:two-component system NtrC family sensor kinase
MKLTRTIAFRLFLLIASIQTIILLALTYATVRVHESNLMEHVVLSAHRVSEIIARSTRHSMLLNREEEVQNIVTSLRDQPGIEGIRIYNKLGAVIYGTVVQDLGTTVDVNAEACVSCHSGSRLEDPHPPGERFSRIFAKPDGARVLGLITPIRNERQCSNAACHAHPESKTILGVLDVKMSLAAVDEQLLASRNQLLFLSLGSVLLVGMASGGFIWLFVRRPVKKLIAGMEMVSSGRLDHRLEAKTSDEIGQMANTFNDMTEDLARARKEITAWSQTLEQKVREKTADLERAHKQMVHVEKMASLGQLASSVAHELNNPLEGILTFAKLLIKRVTKSGLPAADVQSYCEDLTLIAEEAQRSGTIVKNLLVFSRQKGMSFHSVHLNTILERCNLLVNHHAKMNNVELRMSCTPDDMIECDPGQIQQLLIALMVNAIEAMSPVPGRPEGGILTVDARWSEKHDSLAIEVKDTGMGMSDEVKAHIFEPFFTTKSEGKGVGLGLAIAYGIVERHHGSIEVESEVGRGTLFTVSLPTKQPGDQSSQGLASAREGAQA